MKDCIDLRKTYGDRFRIGHDDAVSSLNCSPNYYTIPCKFGRIIPLGGDKLGARVSTKRRANTIHQQIPELKIHQNSDMEVIFIFTADLFERVAEAMKARKRPILSPERRVSLSRRMKAYQETKRNSESLKEKAGLPSQNV